MGAPNTTPGEWLLMGDTVYALDDQSGVNRFSARPERGFVGGARTSDAELLANAYQMRASGELYDALADAHAVILAIAPGLVTMLGQMAGTLALARGES